MCVHFNVILSSCHHSLCMYICYVYFNKDQSINQSINQSITTEQNKKTILTVCEGTRGKDLWKKSKFAASSERMIDHEIVENEHHKLACVK